MEQEVNFFIVKTPDNKIQFNGDNITITVDRFLYHNGKHQITDPSTAKAHFVCAGEQYIIENTSGALTVEDWYFNELLPGFQRLDLLRSLNLSEEYRSHADNAYSHSLAARHVETYAD